MPDIQDLIQIAPFVALAAGALIVIAVDLIVPEGKGRPWAYGTAVGALLLTAWYLWELWPEAMHGGERLSSFFGAMWSDPLSMVLALLLTGVALFVVLMSLANPGRDMAGYLSLVLFAVLGMMVMGGAGDLMVLFLALEVFSMAIYALVAFQRERPESREGAFKYFLLGSLASGFLLYGFALIYGATGTINLALIAQYAAAGTVAPLFQAGFGLAVVGFAFKMALVPFHFWAPDAYEAAPTAVTGFMSVGTKAAALVALVRFLWATVPVGADLTARYMLPVAVLAGVSMIVGSLGALFQTNMKRLLAYSGITHAGYLLMPLITLEPEGLALSMFYLFAYMFMTMGAFSVLSALEARGEIGIDLDANAGLYTRQPWLAGLMALFFLAMAGMPPTIGFTGKLLLVGGGIRAGQGGLVAALVISTGISAWVYLRVVMTMFRRTDGAEAPAPLLGRAEAAAPAEIAAGTEESGDAPGAAPDELSGEVAGVGSAVAGPVADDGEQWGKAWVHTGIGIALLLTATGTVLLGMFPNGLLNMLQELLLSR